MTRLVLRMGRAPESESVWLLPPRSTSTLYASSLPHLEKGEFAREPALRSIATRIRPVPPPLVRQTAYFSLIFPSSTADFGVV